MNFKLFGILALSLAASCQSFESSSTDAAAQDAAPGDAMALMMEIATPGVEHGYLAAMTGTWDAEITFWMTPDAPPQRSTGVLVNRMVLGGRFLRGDFSGSMEMEGVEMPFTGVSYLGFDKAVGKYVGTWISSNSTVFMPTSFGTDDGTGTVFELHRTMTDPMSGQTLHATDRTTMVDEDRMLFEMFYEYEGGDAWKSLEIEYTRL